MIESIVHPPERNLSSHLLQPMISPHEDQYPPGWVFLESFAESCRHPHVTIGEASRGHMRSQRSNGPAPKVGCENPGRVARVLVVPVIDRAIDRKVLGADSPVRPEGARMVQKDGDIF